MACSKFVYADPSTNTCVSICPVGYYADQNNLCLQQCPRGFIANTVTRICDICTDDSEEDACQIEYLTASIKKSSQVDNKVSFYFLFNQVFIFYPPANNNNMTKDEQFNKLIQFSLGQWIINKDFRVENIKQERQVLRATLVLLRPLQSETQFKALFQNNIVFTGPYGEPLKKVSGYKLWIQPFLSANIQSTE